MSEKELQSKLDKSEESLKKAGEIIKELKAKQEKGLGKETQETIERLEKELEEKNAKVIELAESVAKTQAPPRRVKLNLKYSNKYTPDQIKAFKKNGISTEHLDTEPEPVEQPIEA